MKKGTAQFGLAVAGITAGLVCAEVYLRWAAPAAIRVRGNTLVLPRNQELRYSNVSLAGCPAQVLHRKNSLGFRGEEPPADFEKTLTLLAVGGSTTECYYLSDGQTWPDVLGHRLKAACRRVWVNNAGLDGQSTFGHQVLMRDYVIPLRPKVVLFLAGINDVERNDLSDYDRSLSRSASLGALQKLAEKSAVVAYFLNIRGWQIAKHSGLVHSSVQLTRLPTLADPSPERRRQKCAFEVPFLKGFEERLETLVHMCRQAGIEPVLITQPALYGFGRDGPTGVDLARIQVLAGGNGRAAWEILELYNDRTRDVAHRRDVLLIDLAKALPKNSRFFYDFYHFTVEGAQKVADLISQSMLAHLQTQYPSWCP